jgi:hypothetical protein
VVLERSVAVREEEEERREDGSLDAVVFSFPPCFLARSACTNAEIDETGAALRITVQVGLDTTTLEGREETWDWERRRGSW